MIWERHPVYNLTVSTTGLVRGKKGQLLKQSVTNGYRRIGYRTGGKCITLLIHRLVLETFMGPCPEGMECLHEDGIRWNNVLTNLRWGTHVENAQDMARHGRSPKGERNWSHKSHRKYTTDPA